MERFALTTYLSSMVHPPKSARQLVLIVEDDLELRQLTAAILEETSLEIVECESAEAALAVMLIRGAKVALILADIHLSGAMDGVDFAREAKIRWPHLFIILTSGNAGRRNRALFICPNRGTLPQY